MLARLIAASLPLVPKAIVRRIARRYVAGESQDDALRRVAELNQRGFAGALGLLGEEVSERSAAEQAVGEYRSLLERIAGRSLDANISIKLTLLGLRIDEGFCRDNLLRVVDAAAAHRNFVRIDMEDHTTTDATLRLYRAAHQRHRGVGTVLQAYLRRTEDDIRHQLPEEGVNLRLCKGIYLEPPSVAYRGYDEVRRQFERCLELLLERGVYLGIASHDDWVHERANVLLRRFGRRRDQYEFQTLLGVTDKRRDALLRDGHRVRVYVPYGSEWYAYSVRRLRENPRIALYVLRALLGGA